VPFDAPTLQGCQARPNRQLSAALLRTLRETVREPFEGNRGLACVKVSRAITDGDSVLVAVATVGDAEADGVVESSIQWVWFSRQHSGGHGRLIPDPYGGTSDVAPVRDVSRC
jgi:hypothetical protein